MNREQQKNRFGLFGLVGEGDQFFQLGRGTTAVDGLGGQAQTSQDVVSALASRYQGVGRVQQDDLPPRPRGSGRISLTM